MSSQDLTRISGADLAGLLAAGDVSSVEATQAHLDRIAAVDGELHAFLHVNERALDEARAIDERRAAGERLHELALKAAPDLILTDLVMPGMSGRDVATAASITGNFVTDLFPCNGLVPCTGEMLGVTLATSSGYRYRVFEQAVPLRNQIWNPS